MPAFIRLPPDWETIAKKPNNRVRGANGASLEIRDKINNSVVAKLVTLPPRWQILIQVVSSMRAKISIERRTALLYQSGIRAANGVAQLSSNGLFAFTDAYAFAYVQPHPALVADTHIPVSNILGIGSHLQQ